MGERVPSVRSPSSSTGMNLTTVEQSTDLSFVCTWKFELHEGCGGMLFSQFFNVGDGMRCRLGISSRTSSGYFSLYLQLGRPDSTDFVQLSDPDYDFDPFVYFELLLMNQLDHSKSVSKDSFHRFSKKEGVLCVSDFANIDLLSNTDLGFVLNNCLIVKAEISLLKEKSGYYYYKAPLSLIRSEHDEGYATIYKWSIHNFESLREIAKKREIFDVKSRSFQTAQRDFQIVVYPRGLSDEGHFGFILEPKDPYPFVDQLSFSVVTLCILNKDTTKLKSQTCPNPVSRYKFGSDRFISFTDLLDSSSGFVEEGTIKLLASVITLKDTISKNRGLLNDEYGLDLSGEFVIWRVDNFYPFVEFLQNKVHMESLLFEAHGCELRVVMTIEEGSVWASLKCEKVQEDFGYKIGVWNANETLFATSTFYNPSVCLMRLADVKEDESMTFILHFPSHSDLEIFEGMCELEPSSNLWKPYATVCSNYPQILKRLLDPAMEHTTNDGEADIALSNVFSVVRNVPDLVIPILNIMRRELVTRGQKNGDCDDRIQLLKKRLDEIQSVAALEKQTFEQKIKELKAEKREAEVQSMNCQKRLDEIQSVAALEKQTFEQKINELKAEKREAEVQSMNCQKRLDEIQSVAALEKQTFEQKINELKAEKREAEVQSMNCQKRLDEIQSVAALEKQTFEQKINELKAEKREAEVKSMNCQKRLDEIQIVAALEKQTFEQKINELKAEKRETEVQSMNCQKRLDEIQSVAALEKETFEQKINELKAEKREAEVKSMNCQMALAATERNTELVKKRSREDLAHYVRVNENLNGERHSLAEQISQLKQEVWQLGGEKAEKDGRITRLEIENGMLKENLNFFQNKLMEERSISAALRGYGLDGLPEAEIDRVLRFHVERVDQTHEAIKRRRLGGQH